MHIVEYVFEILAINLQNTKLSEKKKTKLKQFAE